MEESFTPLTSLVGGMLIGLAVSLVWLARGRMAGISGILGTAIATPTHAEGRWTFLAGLVGVGLIAGLFAPDALASTAPRSAGVLVIAGLLVGFGTRLGGGCTSGHGICGLARGRLRSLVATLTFMVGGAVTVWLWGVS